MSRVTELEKALTTLFRKGTEVGYTETEIDEFLENIDYHALLQAVWNKAETVYAYREVLYLTYFEDMSYAQAAEVTGKTVKQITNMVYRGKESLRRLLEREGITNAES